MFIPNMTCQIAPNTGRSLYGEDVPGTSFPERCAIAELKASALDTSPRALISGSQTHAEDLAVTASVMLTPATRAKIGDQLSVTGQVLRIVSLAPQFSTMGQLDHYLAGGTPWV